jgi:hypothetical protein
MSIPSVALADPASPAVPDVVPLTQRSSAVPPTAAERSAALERVGVPGGKLVANQLEFNGGTVVLSFGDDYYDCPAGWLCLFENADYNLTVTGYMWKFQSVTPSWQDLYAYGAGNQTTSWRNRHSHLAYLWDSDQGAGTRCLSPGYAQANVGADFNDKADKVWITSSTSLC